MTADCSARVMQFDARQFRTAEQQQNEFFEERTGLLAAFTHVRLVGCMRDVCRRLDCGPAKLVSSASVVVSLNR